VFTQEELERMAAICLRRGLLICSDEIHSDLVFSGQRHIPVASLAPEIARRTITVLAPSKTFNIAGLHSAVAVITDPELRHAFQQTGRGLVTQPNVLALTATLAAYREGEAWLKEVLAYLEANRDYLAQYIRAELPGLVMTKPEGTHLAWLDCRATDLGANPAEFFLQQARVALNNGATFGHGGEGFVRLNFGCPRPVLTQALDRMKQALLARRGSGSAS
jgi:cystathionine beta-lyase